MGKRIDLSTRQNTSNLRPNKDPRSFYMEDTSYEEEQNDNNIESENETIEQEEIQNNINNGQSERPQGFISGLRQGIANGIGNIINREKEESSKEAKQMVVKTALKNPIARRVLLICILLSLIIILIVIIAASLSEDEYNNGLATGGYYAMRCPEVTVIFTDKSNNYEVTGTNTYPLEEYVAGVVAGEVGFLNNVEIDKEFAIAARTYLLTHDDNCTIESSDRKQVFRELTGSSTDNLAMQAAEETKGKVLLLDNQLYSVQYDAFCSIDIDNNYYTIKQANQKIPRNWVDSQSGISSTWKQGNCEGNHGNGLSQWGSLYLAVEQGYTYDKILQYYLGNDVVISSTSLMSIAGLEIKDTTDATELHESLSTFLPKNGSSVDDLNNFITTNVNNNGYGTRAGVVTAAVSLVNYLYDGAKVRIPYYWGGHYQHVGVDPSFGGQSSNVAISNSGSTYYYNGFDCSGFVSWAIRNGGYNVSRHTTAGFHRDYSSDSCDISNSSCIGQPGDLINSDGCHVQMIVSVDEASGKYYVAESTGSHGLIMRAWNMHAGNCGNKETRVLHMNSLYGD